MDKEIGSTLDIHWIWNVHSLTMNFYLQNLNYYDILKLTLKNVVPDKFAYFKFSSFY